MTLKKSSPYERACSRICFLAARSSGGNGARVWEDIVLPLRSWVGHQQVGDHREVPRVQRDDPRAFRLGGCGDQRVGQADAMALAILPQKQTRANGDLLVNVNHHGTGQEGLDLDS